mmetsp:Transcript_30565/g.82749  ORF Transcript_30565/g.82749 Transcript_30565/m.82749 type:complete len:266 (-) Transcript_30565:674-1471(-)
MSSSPCACRTLVRTLRPQRRAGRRTATPARASSSTASAASRTPGAAAAGGRRPRGLLRCCAAGRTACGEAPQGVCAPHCRQNSAHQGQLLRGQHLHRPSAAADAGALRHGLRPADGAAQGLHQPGVPGAPALLPVGVQHCRGREQRRRSGAGRREAGARQGEPLGGDTRVLAGRPRQRRRQGRAHPRQCLPAVLQRPRARLRQARRPRGHQARRRALPGDAARRHLGPRSRGPGDRCPEQLLRAPHGRVRAAASPLRPDLGGVRR